MCLAKAFINKNGESELLVEEIASVKAEGGRLLLTTLFGEKREIEADIKEIDFRASRILLEKAGV
jgi:predicted RNA-binding protein